jgi:hypothetical protein
MKQRLPFVVFVMFCVGIPLFAQGTSRFSYPVKMGRLEPGDKLKISMVKASDSRPSYYGMPMVLNVVILSDNKLGRIIPVGFPGFKQTSMHLDGPPLNDVQAGGLTVPELEQLIEQRFAEKDFKMDVAVQFTGAVAR